MRHADCQNSGGATGNAFLSNVSEERIKDER
jgi:hypothetical protein